MFENEIIEKVDANNTKALSIMELVIKALENGIDDFDLVSSLEAIRDYLKSNETVFAE